MENEKIPFYFDPEVRLFLDLLESGKESHLEQRKRHGFECRQIASEFFYVSDSDIPFHEIFVYSRAMDDVQICELWDHVGTVFCFCTRNEIETFKLIKEYIAIVSDLCQIESNMHTLNMLN
jgi:hypothetical protein